MPGKRKSAFSAVLREAQTHNGETEKQSHGETVSPQERETSTLHYSETPERLISNTVTRQDSKTVEPESSKTVSPYEKVSFYITPEQALKLDDLAHDFRRAHGKRINRNDIVRYVLDRVTLKSLEGMSSQQVLTTDLEGNDEAQVAALEEEIQRLKNLLAINKRFHADTEVRHFKSWLRKHPQPTESDFFQRFLTDTRLPQHASRAFYEAKLRAYAYSEEDVHLFEETWKDMLVDLT